MIGVQRVEERVCGTRLLSTHVGSRAYSSIRASALGTSSSVQRPACCREIQMSTANGIAVGDDPRDSTAEAPLTFPETWQNDQLGAARI